MVGWEGKGKYQEGLEYWFSFELVRVWRVVGEACVKALNAMAVRSGVEKCMFARIEVDLVFVVLEMFEL